MNRRTLLRRGVAAAGVVGTAGCLERVPLLSSENSVTVPDAGDPTYRRWLPGTDGLESVDGYTVRYESVADLRGAPRIEADRDLRRWLVAGRLDRLRKRWDDFGIGVEDVEDVVRLDGAADYADPSPRADVVRGSFDPEAVGETLAESDFDRSGTYRGFRVFRRGSPPRATGVGEGGVVHVRAEAPEGFLRRIADARRGEAPRRHETDADFGRLVEGVGQPAVGAVSRRAGASEPNPDALLFEGGVGVGKAWFVGDAAVYARFVLPFGSESAAETDPVREAMTDDDRFDGVEVSRTGRAVFADARIDLDS
ncbi:MULTISPECIES: hypothetical protein [Halorussus]|uniref:hypothetical protein n=1 Tax=Halorussus TaxID=1070314 RepID=UPI000E216DAA|nr:MULTISPECIES: hypothetical protein [Halorussus]NHN60756.1 hypothetical protein [Halorussus sp. JP-T4]